MGRLVFFILKIYKNLRLSWLNITGRKEADIHARRFVSGRAWSAFCENLKTAGAALSGRNRCPICSFEGFPKRIFQRYD